MVRKPGRRIKDTGRWPDWDALVAENENRLYRMALAILGNPQEAEDAVQDTFLKFLEKTPQHIDNPGAWLMRVLINGCKSRLRLAWRKVGSLPDDLPAPEPEEWQKLEEIMSLSQEERIVVHLFYYEGYSTEEIAHMTGVKAGTVRSRLSRARTRLKKLLVDEGRDLDE